MAKEVTKINPMVQFDSFLESGEPGFRKSLPAHIPSERFIRVVRNAAIKNPDLIACDRRSLLQACNLAAQQGLLPDGVEGAIVAYGNKAQWIPMYQGYLKLFRQSGEFKWVGTGVVYENDVFEHWTDDDGEHIRHRPADDHEGMKVRKVYAMATTLSGGRFIAALSMSEIEKHRKQSRAKREDSPWMVWWEAMARKTAIRVLYKMLPKSTDIDLLEASEEDEGGESPTERQQPPRTISALDQFAGSQREAAEDTGEYVTDSPAAGDEARVPAVPGTAEDYWLYADATIHEMLEQGASEDAAEKWLFSAEQRSVRSKLQIPIDDVTDFRQRMFGAA